MSDTIGEVEVYGKIYENGVKTEGTYYVELQPDPITAPRLHSPDSRIMWASTADTVDFQFGWFDPAGGGACGSLAQYVSGDTLHRAHEQHDDGPGEHPPATRKERHCIRPGRYHVTVHQGSPAGTPVKEFDIDYAQVIPGSRVTNNTAGVYEQMIEPAYNDTLASAGVSDLILNIDLAPSGAFTDNAVLDIDNAGSNVTKSTFQNDPAPTGTTNDYFRFSVARSTSTWTAASPRGGTMLTKFWWDWNTNNSNASGYIDAHAFEWNHLIQPHKYSNEITSSRSVTVGINLMRPDEPVATSPQLQRTLQVNVAPAAAFRAERTQTWQSTDQYLVATSPRGANYQYRWQTTNNGLWTAFTSDTLYDFPGHGSTGTYPVTLEAKNTSTNETISTSTSFSVSAGAVSITGPDYITTKAGYNYSSNHTGNWYERYDPQLTWTGPTATNTSTLTRIWPAGDYTVQLRQEVSDPTILKRGRAPITVCTTGGACGALASTGAGVGLAGSGAADASADVSGGLFGAGPVLSWGSAIAPGVVRLYDLWGMPDLASAFGAPTWLSESGGEVASGLGPRALSWHVRPTTVSGAVVYGFTVASPAAAGAYVFGLALDPDLGANAADDRSGFDAQRGLVYAYDGAEAIGFLLLAEQRGSAAASVRQYGAHGFAPATRAAVWQAQHTAGVRLLDVPDDVQFLLSAAPRSGPAQFRLAVLRGTTVADLQRQADDVLAGK